MANQHHPTIPSLAINYEKNNIEHEIYEGMSTKGPFERLDPNPGLYEIIKTLVLGVTLLPLRLAITTILLIAAYTFAKLYILIDNEKKFSQATLTKIMRIITRSELFACGFHYIEVYGNDDADHLKKKGSTIIVSTHVSFWEVLYFMSSPSCPSFVFKNDCLNIPIVGEIALKALQGIGVDNKNVAGGGGSAALLERVQKMEESEDDAGEYRPLLIFPEGTTSNGSSIISFRSGGFVPGVAVKPVLVSLPFQHFSTTYESIYTSVLIIRTLCQFHNRMQVRYLRDYIPSLEEQQDAKLFAENVRNVMAKAANLPLCDVSYKDKRAYHVRLTKRLDSFRFWGWMSNFLYVNPPILEEEASMEKLVYRYRRPYVASKSAESETSSDTETEMMDIASELTLEENSCLLENKDAERYTVEMSKIT